jgi:hypothetical protein
MARRCGRRAGLQIRVDVRDVAERQTAVAGSQEEVLAMTQDKSAIAQPFHTSERYKK